MDKVLEGRSKDVGRLFAKLTLFIMDCFNQSASSAINWETAKLEVDLIAGGIDKNAINKIVSKVEKCVSTERDICLLASGDLYVHVTGTGVGGQCSEMADSIPRLHTIPRLHPYPVSIPRLPTLV